MNDLVYRWATPSLSSEGQKLLLETVASGQWSYGPIARQVERELANILQVKNVLLTNSGSSALWILLSLAKRDIRQSIIVPAFGYSAAANIAASLGYDIYIADSCFDAPVVDPESVKRLLDDNVAFVIGIDYFGYSVGWDQIPKNKQYKIIEDAAGSYGARYKNRPCGSNAEMSIMSFHTSKAAAGGGEGGCILSDDDDLISSAKAAGRNGHVKGYYYSELPGMNMLMTDLAACFLIDSLNDYGRMYQKRKRIVSHLDEVAKISGLTLLEFNHSVNERTQNYQTYVMLVENRDLIIKLLRVNGIEARPCWPFLISEQPAIISAIKKVDGNLSNAKRFADQIINIPVNPTMKKGQIDKLANVFSQISEIGIKLNNY